MEQLYNYFVSYWWCSKDTHGYGNGEFPLKRIIESLNDIRELEKYLMKKYKCKNVILLNYQLIK